jgi:hypothetical protein
MGGAIRNAYKILVGKCKVKRPLGRPRRRCIILKCILGKWVVEVKTGFIWFMTETGSGFL